MAPRFSPPPSRTTSAARWSASAPTATPPSAKRSPWMTAARSSSRWRSITRPTAKRSRTPASCPATVVAETEAQVDYDDNGEPLPPSEQQQVEQKKTTEEDPVVKKALEVLK